MVALTRSVFHGFVAVLTALLLVAAVAVPANAVPTQTVHSTKDTVPPIVSAPLKHDKSSTPKGDFSQLAKTAKTTPAHKAKAMKKAKAPVFDKNTSKVVKRNEFSNTYLNADGTHTSEIARGPINVPDGKGWKPAAVSVEHSDKSGWYVPNNPLSPRFANNADDRGVFSVSRDGYKIGFTLQGARNSGIEHVTVPFTSIGANTVFYRDVFDNVNLVYNVDVNQVKESLVLSKAPAKKDSVWHWTISAPGLTLVKNADNDLEFQNAEGTPQFLVPAPYMWDSSGIKDVQAPVMAAVDYDITKAGSQWELTMRLDRKWLNDKSRVYPVIVDPTIGPVGGDSIQAYKSDGAHVAGTVQIGNSRDGGTNKYWRTVLH